MVPTISQWRLASALVLVTVVAACGGSSTSTQGGSGKLVVTAGGGSYGAALNAAYLQAFANETGIKVEQVAGGDDPVAAVKSQVQSGNVQWDAVNCAPTIVLANPDIWEPIDRSIVNVPTDQLFYPGEIGDKYVASDVETFPAMGYSTKAFPNNHPASWADYFDVQKFPGPRGAPNVGLDSAWLMPAIALLADGVSADHLVPLDLDRAYKKLDQLKPKIRVFWTTFSQSQDILRSGEVVMTPMTDGRAEQLVATGQPVGVMFNQAFRYTAAFCVAKGAPNAKNAMRLLNYMLTHPKQQAIFTSLTFYGPTTKSGADEARKLGVKDFSTLHADTLIPDSPELLNYIRSNSQSLLSRWNAWVGA
jgi:spermidine/putrescine-binding protein